MNRLTNELTYMCNALCAGKELYDEYKPKYMGTEYGIYQHVLNTTGFGSDPGRKQDPVFARQISHAIANSLKLRDRLNTSLSKIGNEIGGKNHATVLHSCKTISNFIQTGHRVDDIIKCIIHFDLTIQDLIYYKNE